SQVFLSQEFVVNPEKKVEQVLAENKASVTKFVRYQVGEGLEKRQDDFAKEVAEQMK
ncbi:MAG: elongation factor Ts, partial [Bacilli bacterium]|nr:elongation factor Ts [Bacilli bacterium]